MRPIFFGKYAVVGISKSRENNTFSGLELDDNLKRQKIERHCQSKFVYFAKMSEPDFAAIDFLAFLRVDLSGSMAAPSI